jgi:outer membrane protein
MKLFKILLLVSGFYLTTGIATGYAVPGNLNIAVVDVSIFQDQFLDEVNAKLQVDFKDRQAAIQKMLDTFRADEAKLQKDARIMTAKKVEEQRNSLVKQQSDLQAEAKKYEEDLLVKRQEILKTKLDSLMQVVSALSAKNKYDFVFAKNVALFVDPQYDITQQVVNDYQEAAKIRDGAAAANPNNKK